MKKHGFLITFSIVVLTFLGCSKKIIPFSKDNLEVVNRDITSINDATNTLILNNQKSIGVAIFKNIKFSKGIIEIDLKGENKPQGSFVGVAFNIQNDSTYEAIYFRPFNFQSDKKIRREHSIQYIYKPKFEWRFLRKNYTGQYEAEYPRQPSPDDWFSVKIKIDENRVYVYDVETNTELLSVKRLTKQLSNKLGLWTGYNSKGAFRNLKIEQIRYLPK